jgi:hypothetical protein
MITSAVVVDGTKNTHSSHGQPHPRKLKTGHVVCFFRFACSFAHRWHWNQTGRSSCWIWFFSRFACVRTHCTAPPQPHSTPMTRFSVSVRQRHPLPRRQLRPRPHWPHHGVQHSTPSPWKILTGQHRYRRLFARRANEEDKKKPRVERGTPDIPPSPHTPRTKKQQQQQTNHDTLSFSFTHALVASLVPALDDNTRVNKSTSVVAPMGNMAAITHDAKPNTDTRNHVNIYICTPKLNTEEHSHTPKTRHDPNIVTGVMHIL